MQTMVSPEIAARIEEWTDTQAGGLMPLHEVRDTTKYDALVTDMNENGWIGAPLVADGEQAVTGSHRYWAAVETFTDIPRIDVTDLCDLFDIDWTNHRDSYSDYLDAYIALSDILPRAVVDYLGIDIH